MKYVMLIAGGDDGWEDLGPEQLRAEYDRIWAYLEKWETVGKIVDGGAELEHPRQARTVRRGADGQLSVVDGPYVELKEFLGGFLRLECDDLDEAVAVASGWPGLDHGALVEVRPVVLHNTGSPQATAAKEG
jgi:hypothetical protein